MFQMISQLFHTLKLLSSWNGGYFQPQVNLELFNALIHESESTVNLMSLKII